MNRPLPVRLAAAAAAVPLALALAACGDGGSDAAPADATTTTTGTSSSSSSTGATDVEKVAATGLAAVKGGTVFSVDREDAGGWEVSVVTADGTEHDVRVAADGTVQGSPTTEVDDGDDRVRDRDERKRLLGASVDYRAAVAAAAARAGGAALTGFDLDEERGAATWEVTYGDDTPDEVTVHVDADSGKVLRTERDD